MQLFRLTAIKQEKAQKILNKLMNEYYPEKLAYSARTMQEKCRRGMYLMQWGYTHIHPQNIVSVPLFEKITW